MNIPADCDSVSYSSLSSEEDAIAAEKFFAEKDTSSYAQPLSQVSSLSRRLTSLGPVLIRGI
jgi:hypothetical protein